MTPQVQAACCFGSMWIHLGILFSIDAALSFANIALNKPTTQSTIYTPPSTYCKNCTGLPSNAVDGNLDPSYIEGSCTHTDPSDTAPWWQVDLETPFQITKVAILNRLDFGHRLKAFEIEVSLTSSINEDNKLEDGMVCFRNDGTSLPGGVVTTMTCNQPIEGRFIRISEYVSEAILTLCEVIVTGIELDNASIDQKNTTETPTENTTLNDTNVTSLEVTPSYSQAQTTEPSESVTYTDTTLPSRSNTTCSHCQCKYTNASLKYLNKTIDDLIQELQQTLTVSKTTTSSFKRKLISARDDRPSSQSIGYVGVVILVAIGMAIIVPDVITMINTIYGKKHP